jgi:hypothetical protein
LDKKEVRVTITKGQFHNIIEGKKFVTDNVEVIRTYLKKELPGQVTPGQAKKRKTKAKKAGGVPGGASALQLQTANEVEEDAYDVSTLQLQTSDEEEGEDEEEDEDIQDSTA